VPILLANSSYGASHSQPGPIQRFQVLVGEGLQSHQFPFFGLRQAAVVLAVDQLQASAGSIPSRVDPSSVARLLESGSSAPTAAR